MNTRLIFYSFMFEKKTMYFCIYRQGFTSRTLKKKELKVSKQTNIKKVDKFKTEKLLKEITN